MYVAKCPECSSTQVWKDGLRKTIHGDIQRYLCRNCGFRFSERSGQSFYRSSGRGSACQIGAKPQPGLVENLVTVEPPKEGLAGATADIKGKLVGFAWYLKKEGYQESTIRTWTKTLRQLIKLGANLLDSDSVKDVIANRETWSETTKANVASCFSTFARSIGFSFNSPRYIITRKLPFIPTEKELDQLIAACGKKTATFLQLLKETAMRSGEAWRIEWIDLDTETRTLTLNNPEKRGNSRMFKLSPKMVSMLQALPKKSERIFPKSLKARRICFCSQRKKIAEKLQNPRINRITFHTFRHWKATMEYHKTKDILYVKQLLGHKRIEATMIYTQLITFETDDYHVKVATSLKEACDLVEAGFEYVTDMEQHKIFRKRK